MKNIIKKIYNKPIVLLALAVVLLVISAVGGTQAALVYESKDLTAQVKTQEIGVGIVENGVEIGDKVLLDDVDNTITLGKKYPEELSVKNTGDIEAYVRVIIKKSWLDANKEIKRDLSPEYIELKLANVADDENWIVGDEDANESRIVLYYKEPLGPEAVTDIFAKELRIDPAFETTVEVEEDIESKPGYTIITYTHPFDGYTFQIELEADAVQSYAAKDAIKSAWGIDVDIDSNGILSLSKMNTSEEN